MTIPTEQAEAAKDRATPGLLARPGVVGVGVTAQGSRAAIQILVRERTPDLIASLPNEIEGHPVVIEEVGAIRTL
jgi:hypothetical protein